jgi:hypothetical protein
MLKTGKRVNAKARRRKEKKILGIGYWFLAAAEISVLTKNE